MKVLVDTSVWSTAFRRKEPCDESLCLGDLVLSSLVVMIGPVRQELLSGIKSEKIFLELRELLDEFEDLPIYTRDYEKAAQFFNICRRHGIQGSQVDFLICAVAYNNNLLIYTTDKDFENYARHLPIRLFRS